MFIVNTPEPALKIAKPTAWEIACYLEELATGNWFFKYCVPKLNQTLPVLFHKDIVYTLLWKKIVYLL